MAFTKKNIEPQKADVTVNVKSVSGGQKPEYANDFAAGADLRAAHGISLRRGDTALVGTGIAVEIPPGYEGQIRPRSGLSLKHGIIVMNAPGTIDCDYRGEVKVILKNLSGVTYSVKTGDKIAQLVIAPVSRAKFRWAKELSETDRADSGFGSTGTK